MSIFYKRKWILVATDIAICIEYLHKKKICTLIFDERKRIPVAMDICHLHVLVGPDNIEERQWWRLKQI
jgi:hypothetical protein